MIYFEVQDGEAAEHSGGLDIWVLSIYFEKSNIGWPQQPLTERLPSISKNLDFWWFNPQKGASIGHFCASGDEIIKIRKFFWGKRAFEVIEAIEVSKAAEVNEAAYLSEARKITNEFFRVSQVLEFNNLMTNIPLFWCLKTRIVGRIIKYQAKFWHPFLSEAVEVSQCYFFENRLIKLKCPNLLNVLLPFFKLGSQL